MNINFQQVGYTLDIKLRMEMGNVSKRQQPDQRAKHLPKATNMSFITGINPHPGVTVQRSSMIIASSIIVNTGLTKCQQHQLF